MLNYFTLFSLSEKYQLDKEELERSYFRLQMLHHPDRSINKSEAEKIQISMRSADINDGYKILADDVDRANHLLALNNILVNKEKDNTYQPTRALLVEQMELRERAGEIESGLDNKAELLTHIESEFEGSKKEFNEYYQAKNFEQAAQAAIKLRYLNKLKQELDKN